MVRHIKFVVYWFIFNGLLHSVLSIKCWACRSSDDPKCGEGRTFDNSTLPITDCSREHNLSNNMGMKPTLCRKIKQKVNGQWDYVRDCAYEGAEGIQRADKNCFKRKGTDNMDVEYCICNDKDGCNSSSMLNPLPLLLGALVSVLYIENCLLRIK